MVSSTSIRVRNTKKPPTTNRVSQKEGGPTRPTAHTSLSVMKKFLERVFYVRAEPPLSPSFHPHSFVERFSLGASWASSFQQVLLPDNRPRLPSLRRQLGQDLVAVT